LRLRNQQWPEIPTNNFSGENFSSHLDDFSENAKLSESAAGIEVFESESQKIVYPPGEQSTDSGFLASSRVDLGHRGEDFAV